MEKNLNILALLMVIVLISCEKEDKNEITLTDSSFYAIKDGKKWITTSSGAYYSPSEEKFIISGWKGDSVYYEDEQLYFAFKKTDITKSNTVTDFYSEWNYIVGGDAVSDRYMIDSFFKNLITIDSLDTVNMRIVGTFKIKLVRDKFRSDLGETMYFKNGYFALNYREIE